MVITHSIRYNRYNMSDKTNLFVHLSGNLNMGKVEREDFIRSLFSEFGEIITISIIEDRETGQIRNYCFVEMNKDGANKVIEEFDGKEVDGIKISVNIAQPKTGGDRPRNNVRKFNNNGGGGRRDSYDDRGGNNRKSFSNSGW
jgi:RNA recognition motif-containing protein